MHKSTSYFRTVALVFLSMAFALWALTTPIVAQSGGVKGKVRDQRGNGIANAKIEIREEGRVIKSGQANSKGDFQITGIRSGTYNISFDADGYSNGVLFGVEIRSGIINLGGRLILRVDPGSLVMINGSVYYREGTSITGAKVDLDQINPDGSIRKLASAFTTISGEFTFRRPAGDAKFRITAKFKGVSGSSEVVVDNAAIYRTAIILDISRNDR